MERAQPGPFYSAPDQTQYEYAEAEALDFADQPPTSSSFHHQDLLTNADHNTSLHALHRSPSSVNTSRYSDTFIPTQTMIQSLFVACDIYKEAFDAVYTGNATESDFAMLGRAIMPPEQDGRLWPVVIYVEIAKKTIDYVNRYLLGWFQRWRKPSASQSEMYAGPFSADHLVFLQNAAHVQTGHSPPPWKNTAIRYIGGYPSAWGYALRRNGEPVWTNASLVGPEFDGIDVVIDPIAVLTSSTVSPAYTVSSASSGTAVSSSSSAFGTSILSSSSPACPGNMSSMSSMSSARIPQNKTLTTNASVGSVPPSVPQQGSGLSAPFAMSSEGAAQPISYQTAVHAPYSTVSAQFPQHDDPSYPAQSSNYPPPGHQRPPSMYSPRPTAGPATSSELSFAPARSCVSGYAPPPATGPVHPRSVSGHAPPPATGPAHPRSVSGHAPPPATGPAHPRSVSGHAPPPATGPAHSRVPDYAPPPATDPARQVMSDPTRPVPRAATQDLTLPRTVPYNDFMPDHPSISSVPDAVDAPIDRVSQWTHRADLEMRRENTRQLAISSETKRVDQNLESMRMQMQPSGQNIRKPATPTVRHKGLSNSSLYASSQGSPSLSHPYGPSPEGSSSSNCRRRSNVSIASHPYRSNSSIASHSQHSNSSLTSLHFDRLIVKPSGNPADIPASGDQGYSGGDQASSGCMDGKGVKTWALANALGNDKTSNVPDRSHSDRHELANAMGGCGNTPSGFANTTNGPVHTTEGHARTMYGGAVHATQHVHDAEVTNGRVHPTEGDVYMVGGSANATNGHVHSTSGYVDGSNGRSHGHDGRIPVTDGNVNDGRVPPTYGYPSAINEPVHYMTGGYDDATNGHYLEGSDGNDHKMDDRPGATALYANGSTTARYDTDDAAMSWMYENVDGTAADANPVYAAGGGFPATNGI